MWYALMWVGHALACAPVCLPADVRACVRACVRKPGLSIRVPACCLAARPPFPGMAHGLVFYYNPRSK